MPGPELWTGLLYAVSSLAVALNMWVSAPIGVTYQISHISDIYITIHHTGKITIMK